MDFFQCLGVAWLLLSGCAWCRLTTRDSGSLCSGPGHGGDSDEKLENEAVLPGDTVDTSSESKMNGSLKNVQKFLEALTHSLKTLFGGD